MASAPRSRRDRGFGIIDQVGTVTGSMMRNRIIDASDGATGMGSRGEHSGRFQQYG
jgi:hypothetical protein